MAISHDASSSGAGGAGGVTNYTWNHTCASGAILVVVVSSNSTTDPSGITYNGTAMTKAATVTGNRNASIWYLLNPSSGANVVSVTYASSTTYTQGSSDSYLGCDTGGIGATNTAHDDSGASSAVSCAVTTTVTNSWLVSGGENNGHATITAGGSAVVRTDQNLGTNTVSQWCMDLSTPTVQSNTISGTLATARDWAIAVMEIKPASAVVVTTPRRRIFKHH